MRLFLRRVNLCALKQTTMNLKGTFYIFIYVLHCNYIYCTICSLHGAVSSIKLNKNALFRPAFHNMHNALKLQYFSMKYLPSNCILSFCQIEQINNTHFSYLFPSHFFVKLFAGFVSNILNSKFKSKRVYVQVYSKTVINLLFQKIFIIFL